MALNKKTLIMGLATLATMGALFTASAASGTSTTNTTKTVAASSKVALVHINSATLQQLEKLPGIGKTLAESIIKARPFKNGAELMSKVHGIGPKLWAKIRPYVSFK